MSAITGSNSLSLNFQQGLAYGVGQTQNLPIPLSLKSLFRATGGALDQCDLVYCEGSIPFVAATPQVLDLKALVDSVGAAIAFARVRLFAIRVNGLPDGSTLLVGAAGANEWDSLASAGATVSIYPGTQANDGFALFQMPNATGAAVGSTSHLLKIDPGANACTVDLLIAGCAE